MRFRLGEKDKDPLDVMTDGNLRVVATFKVRPEARLSFLNNVQAHIVRFAGHL
jgi:hypothetical protein